MRIDEKFKVNHWKTIRKPAKFALQILTHAENLDQFFQTNKRRNNEVFVYK